ncbi:MAG: hypothetical protein K2K40_08340 [Paramuribaculum sp.]|nr:hypothetical protein [Paramuribaculum sp.]
MKHLLCSLLLLVAALQTLAVSPEKGNKETKTDFATFQLPAEWIAPPSNVYFGLPEFFEVTTDDGKKHKVFNKGSLYVLTGTETFTNILIISRHRAENGYKAAITDIKDYFDGIISFRSSGKAHLIWMSVDKDTEKGIVSAYEKSGINGKWVYNLYKYVIYIKQIGSDVYVTEVRYKKEESKLTDDEYNRLAKSVINSLHPID